MRVPLHALVACAIVSVCFAASSAAATLTLYPGGDTSLRAASPNQTFGAVPIEIRGGPVPSRALIRFNLNDLRFMLGGGGVLHSAKLRLHVDDSSTWSVSGAGIQLHRIESDWTAIWATWNCPSDSNRSNDVPDCAAPWFGGSMRAETAAGHVLTAGESGWIEIDVTADLSDLVEPGARYGWLLRASDESLEVVAVFGVSETGFAPQLVIEYTPPFSVDDAFAQAVRFEPSSWDPQVVHGFDVQERLVWRHGPEGTQGYRYQGPDGQLVEYVDHFGNRTWLLRDSEGRVMERRHHYRNAGDWSEKTFRDGDGEIVVETIDWSSEALEGRLFRLGVTPGVPAAPMTQSWSEDELGSTNEFANGFSRITLWSSKSAAPTLGEVYYRETSESLGKRMAVTLENTDEGTLARDDWGGWQLYRSDDSGVVSLEDEHGYVFSIERDLEGRPTELWVGDLVKVLYEWDANGRVTKKVVDLRSSEVVMTVAPVIPLGQYHQPEDLTSTQPRRRTIAKLPFVGAAVEWDTLYPWEGHVVATLHGQPYALVPLDGTQPPWRSATPFQLGFMGDRVDYSADEVVVHLETDAGGSDNVRHTRAVILPRRETIAQSGSATVSAAGNRLAWPTAVDGTNRRRTGSAISFCGAANSCICISSVKYDKKSGTSYENLTVRCPTSSGGGGGGRRTEPPTPKPKIPSGNPLQPRQKASLNFAKQLANQAMQDRQKCRDLFRGMNKEDWDEVMNRWNEWRDGEGVHQPGSSRVRCNEGVPAWTITNQPTIFICRKFSDLSRTDAAVTVIHEALHTAGLPENPPITTAETSAEINDRVRKACFGGQS